MNLEGDRLRRTSWWCAILAIAAAGGRAAPAQEVDEPIVASLVRTWDASGVTVVDGLANVPLSIMRAATADTYRLDLTVLDDTGTALFREGWNRELSEAAAAASGPGVSIQESFRFAVRPGSYVLELRAFAPETRDVAASGRVEFEGFAEAPLVSDLILGSSVGAVGEADRASWSIVRGSVGIASAALPTVLSSQPEIYYFLELYPPADAGPWQAAVTADVVRSNGSRVVSTPRSGLEVSGVTPYTGRLPLAGLPAGEYRLVMRVENVETGQSVETSSAFRVREVVDATMSSRSALSTYFEGLSDSELEATFGGVGVIVSEAERLSFEALPADAKRRYLTDFFGRRDPSPLTSGNEFLDEYVERIGVIRQRYEEKVGVGSYGPWDTARGRIYLKYGEPQDKIAEYFPADEGFATSNIGSGSFAGEPPYEIWRYRETGYVYLFVAENRFGAWRLIYSTDPNIVTFANWMERVGNAALQDLEDHFGIQIDRS